MGSPSLVLSPLTGSKDSPGSPQTPVFSITPVRLFAGGAWDWTQGPCCMPSKPGTRSLLIPIFVMHMCVGNLSQAIQSMLLLKLFPQEPIQFPF